MYTNIHVALDGSDWAKGAANVGLELAEGLSSRLTAVHVKERDRVSSRIDRLREMLAESAEHASTNDTGLRGKVRTGWLADDADDLGVSFGSERLDGVVYERID